MLSGPLDDLRPSRRPFQSALAIISMGVDPRVTRVPQGTTISCSIVLVATNPGFIQPSWTIAHPTHPLSGVFLTQPISIGPLSVFDEPILLPSGALIPYHDHTVTVQVGPATATDWIRWETSGPRRPGRRSRDGSMPNRTRLDPRTHARDPDVIVSMNINPPVVRTPVGAPVSFSIQLVAQNAGNKDDACPTPWWTVTGPGTTSAFVESCATHPPESGSHHAYQEQVDLAPGLLEPNQDYEVKVQIDGESATAHFRWEPPEPARQRQSPHRTKAPQRRLVLAPPRAAR